MSEQMPKAPHTGCCALATKAQRELLWEQDYRQVPSEEECIEIMGVLVKKHWSGNIFMYSYAGKDLHQRLMEEK